MYLLKKKIGTKFWIMLLALTILISAFTMPVFAAGQSKKPMPPAKQEETLKSAPISLKEIEEPIPNPQYQYYLNHKEEFTYGYIPPKYIFPQEKTRSIRTRAASPIANIRKYDSRSSDKSLNHFERNVVSPRKDQFYTGTCWAHADLAVVESLLKIKCNQDYDLSEGHMAYNIDNSTNLQSGGLEEDAFAYYARLSGPVLESNFPAYTIDENNPKDRKQELFDPSRADFLPASERDTFKILGDAFNKKLDVFVPKTLELDLTLENLKKCIYENGSVQGTYLIATDGYSKDVLSSKFWDKLSVLNNGVRYHYVRNFKNSNYLKYNHAVALIGWDDDKEITNSLGEKATGAFLVKNSIPAPPFDRYDDARGYHWISYESFLGNGKIVPSFTKIITPRDARLMSQDERKNLKNVYNTGKANYVGEANIKGNLNKAINIYERSNNEPETIKYLTYYNVSDGPAPYKIFITEDADILKGQKTTFANGTQGETLKDIQSDKWVELASGTFTEKGYNTLNVTRPFTLTNDKFALKIEIESKKLGLAYKSWSEGEKVPAISYRYNDENADPFFEKIRDSYCLFLGTVTAKANEYTVTVTDDGNGKATADPSKGPKGTKVTIKADPKPGYEFDKWEVEGTRVANPQASETTLTIEEGNASAKAIFKEIAPTEYTVSFETDYGTKPADQKIKEGEKAKEPQGFKKDITEILDSVSGKTYVFKGWYDGTEEYNFQKEVKENKTLKAKWEEKIIPIVEYTVSFETAYGTKPEDQKIKEGEKAKAPTGFEKDITEILDNASGKTYIFKGWYDGTEEYNFETQVKENKALKAKWEEKIIPIVEYTVSFETTYGTKPEDQKIKEGEKAKEPQGFKKDITEILDNGKTYVFKGWFIGTEEYNFETQVKENKNLTAKWEEKIIPITEYTVSFETTYGTKPEDQKIKENEKAKAPTGFEKDKTEILDSVSGKTYVFKGWFIGTEEYNFETQVKENKILKAKWEEKIIPIVEYTVTVTDDGNGTATANPSKGPKGTKVNLKADPNPGYEFDKWEVEGATALDPQAPETTLTIGEGNVTAKATFKEIPPKEYTVSFETAYGTKPEDQKIKEGEKAKEPQGFEKDTTEILDNASGKTYIFKGWYDGTEEYNFQKEVKENKTLKAKWEEKIIPIAEYTVSFETDYGTKPEDQKVKENGKAKAPTGFEKDTTEILDNASGKTYVFKGWFIGTEEYNFEKEVKENKTLTAKWEEKAAAGKTLEEAKDKAKEEIGKLPNLSDTEKDTYKGQVDKATDKAGVDKAVEDAKAKDAQELKEAKDKAKEEIDKLPNLSDTEKDTYKGQVDKATDKAGVDKAVEDAKAKDAQELKEAKDKAKEEIDKLPNLSDAEKDKYKKQVDDAKTKGQVAKVVEEAKEKSAEGQTPPTPTPTPTPNPGGDRDHDYRHRSYWTYSYGPATTTKVTPAKSNLVKLEAKLVIGSKELIKSVDGVEQKVFMDIAPFIEGNRTMLPIRFVAEALGFNVEWDNDSRTVILIDKENVVKIPVDTNQIIVNGKVYESDVKPVIRNNRTMLPIANIARALGLKDGKDIFWNGNTKEVLITREVAK